MKSTNSKKIKRLAYLLYNTNENGGNKTILQHVALLRKNNYSIEVFKIFGKQPTWFSKDLKTRSFLNLFLKPPDILVATFWPTVWLSFLIRSKKIFFVLGWDEYVHTNAILKMLARKTLLLNIEKIVISKFLKDRIESLSKRTKKIHTLHATSIDDIFFTTQKRNDKKGRRISILSVISRYKNYKGPDLLVQSIKELKRKHPTYTFSLVSLEKYNLSPNIDNFYSCIDREKLIKKYQAADVLLVTSRIEGFFIPGLEAMACRCPIITTKNGGIAEYAKHNYNAVFIDSIEDLWKEDTVEKLLSNKKLLKKIKENGYKTAKKYNWNTTLKQLESIYYQ